MEQLQFDRTHQWESYCSKSVSGSLNTCGAGTLSPSRRRCSSRSCARKCELLPCGLQWRKFVKLFSKPKTKFYWHGFVVRGRRDRGSTEARGRGAPEIGR